MDRPDFIFENSEYITAGFDISGLINQKTVRRHYKAGAFFPSNDKKAIGITVRKYDVCEKEAEIKFVNGSSKVVCPSYPEILVVRSGDINVFKLAEIPSREAMEVLKMNFKFADGSPYTSEYINENGGFENFDFSDFEETSVFETNGKKYIIEKGVIYNADKSVLIYCDQDKTGEFKLPETVKIIGYKAFVKTKLSYIELNKGIEVIGEYAFEGFDDISHTVVIPETVQYIAPNAFKTIRSWNSWAGSMAAHQKHERIHADIVINKEKDALDNAPWGACFAKVLWKTNVD